jgi:hypothetical protein
LASPALFTCANNVLSVITSYFNKNNDTDISIHLNVHQIEYQTTIFLHLQAVTVEGSKITKFDLSASNGVVHVINKVMTPPAGDIVDLVAGNSDLSTLKSYFKILLLK